MNTVMRAFHQGGIPGERIGHMIRFDLQHVREAMQQRARKEQQAPAAADAARIGDSRPRGTAGSTTGRQTGAPKARHSRRQA